MSPLTESVVDLLQDCMYPHGLCSQDAFPLTMARRPKELVSICAGTRSDRHLLVTLVGTGMRWGEATALRVMDLDLDGTTGWGGQGIARLRIWRAWKRNPTGKYHRPDLPTWYTAHPKSDKSKRRITLAPYVVNILREQIAGKPDEALIFTAPQGGRVHQATWFEDRWKLCLDRAQDRGYSDRPRIHDLRHTHAIWLINAGVPLPVIQNRLGHDSIQITVDTYGGFLDQSHEVADAAIDAALRGQKIAHPGRGITAAELLVVDDQDTADPIADFDDDDEDM